MSPTTGSAFPVAESISRLGLAPNVLLATRDMTHEIVDLAAVTGGGPVPAPIVAAIRKIPVFKSAHPFSTMDRWQAGGILVGVPLG